MYISNPAFTEPDDKNVKVWRYMNIPKFFSMIDNQALFFSRVKIFDDPLEGSIPQSKDQINLTKHFGRESNIMYSDDGSAHEWYSDPYLFKSTAYNCCFHMSAFESAAFWKIYTKENSGVAIQSTVTRLCNCFKEDRENVEHIGIVKYIDFSPDSSDTIDVLKHGSLPLLHKMKSFEYEHELRVIIPFPHRVFPNGGELTKEILDNFPVGLLISGRLEYPYREHLSRPFITFLDQKHADFSPKEIQH